MTPEEATESLAPVGPHLSIWVRLVRVALSFRVVLATGLAVITFLTVSNRFNDPDLWWHLKLGQIVWNTHSIPSVDSFSYTAYGHTWAAHEWLAQLSIYSAYRLGGYTGLMLWLAVLASVLFILVYVLCYLSTQDALVAFLGGVCAWYFGTIGLAIRPLILGHIFLATELLLLELGTIRSRRWLWLLPPLFAIWVNCHGSYFLGIGVLTICWAASYVTGDWGPVVSKAWDKSGCKLLGGILILCVLASCCNPVGVRLLLYPLNLYFQQSTNMNAVEEWFAPDLREWRTLGLLGAGFAVLLIPLWRRASLPLRDFLLTVMAFGLAIRHARMMILFGIIVSPILCRLVSPPIGNDRRQEHPVANAALISGFLAAIIWAFPSPAGIQRQIRSANPAGAVDYIRRSKLAGPMLNAYIYGGYLIWALPEERVFIDGRADVFDWTGVFAEYGRWATLTEDPNVLLNKYRIRFCLFPGSSPMLHVLQYLPGWHRVYSDEVAVIYARLSNSEQALSR